MAKDVAEQLLDEAVEGVDEYFDDDIEEETLEDVEEETLEEEEPEEEPEKEREEEEDEDDPLIPITYKNDNGEVLTENIRYSQLSDIYADYQKAHNIINQYYTYYQQTYPIIQNIQQSKILQSVLYYKGQGYTDEQVIQGLLANQSNAKTDVAEDELSLEESIEEKIAKELDKRIKPLETQNQQLLTQQYIETVTTENNKILNEVLKENNISSLTDAELRKMGDLLADMYPNVDLRFLKLTKTAAKALLNMVIQDRAKKAPTMAKITKKISKLPKVVASKTTTTAVKQKSKTPVVGKPLSREDRIRLKNELWT